MADILIYALIFLLVEAKKLAYYIRMLKSK
jgi:hypothetical protein